MRQTAGGGSGGSAADELTKLATLHDQGKLTDQEFERAKAKIVA
ncbi:MAG: SHOCT domain-containing protein [Solirubrobacterales bacterium]